MRALGITLGDVTGIGSEVALKALAREVVADEDTRYVLIGDNAVVREVWLRASHLLRWRL